MTWLLLAAALAVAAGLGLAGVVCLPGTRRRAGLDPRARARWAAAGLAAAVALTYAGLALLAVPAVAGVLPRPLLAAWPRLLAGPGPGGTAVAWLAAALLAVSAGVVTARAWPASKERRLLRVEPGIGTHEHRDGFDLVTLPRTALVAYSLGGRRPQVVVSQGLCDCLDDEGLSVRSPTGCCGWKTGSSARSAKWLPTRSAAWPSSAKARPTTGTTARPITSALPPAAKS